MRNWKVWVVLPLMLAVPKFAHAEYIPLSGTAIPPGYEYTPDSSGNGYLQAGDYGVITVEGKNAPNLTVSINGYANANTLTTFDFSLNSVAGSYSSIFYPLAAGQPISSGNFFVSPTNQVSGTTSFNPNPALIFASANVTPTDVILSYLNNTNGIANYTLGFSAFVAATNPAVVTGGVTYQVSSVPLPRALPLFSAAIIFVMGLAITLRKSPL